METFNKQNIISASISKYVNALFKLSDLRKYGKNQDSFVRIIRPASYDTFTITPESNLDEEEKAARRPYTWQPVFRFDMTNLISKLFGNVDLDLQNLMNSYSSARSLAYGVQIYPNNFNNITANRSGHPNRYDEANVSLSSYIENFLRELSQSVPFLAFDLVAPTDVKWDIATIRSTYPVKPESKKFKHDAYRQLSSVVNLIVSKLFTESDSNRNIDRRSFLLGSETALNPTAIFFTISDDNSSSRRTYSMSGERNGLSEISSSLRGKQGLYMAINVKSLDSMSYYRSEADPLNKNLEDIINTGIFGNTYSTSATSFNYSNVLICKVSHTLRRHSTTVNSYSRHDSRDTNTNYSYDSISADLHETEESTSSVVGIAKRKLNIRTTTQRPCNSTKCTIGPLVHVIHPEPFKRFITSQAPFESKEEKQIYNAASPVNKQEWLSLKLGNSNSHIFDTYDLFYESYIEAKNPKLRKLAEGKYENKTILNEYTGYNRDIKSSGHSKFSTGSPCSISGLVDMPMFGWINYNRPVSNEAMSTIESVSLDLTSSKKSYVSFGRPIPGPVNKADLSGALTTKRMSQNPIKPSSHAWTWTNFSSINPEKQSTKNVYPSLMDYPSTTNEDERGKGKIYVDHDDVGYCPITGHPLVVTTFLVGNHPDHITGGYRSILRPNGFLCKI